MRYIRSSNFLCAFGEEIEQIQEILYLEFPSESHFSLQFFWNLLTWDLWGFSSFLIFWPLTILNPFWPEFEESKPHNSFPPSRVQLTLLYKTIWRLFEVYSFTLMLFWDNLSYLFQRHSYVWILYLIYFLPSLII